MATLVIYIPYYNTPYPWLQFAQNELAKDYSGIDKLIIDFRDKRFLSPFQIVILGCLIESLVQNYGVEPSFKGGGQVLNNHLNNIKFKRYWEEDFNRDRYTESNNGTTLCLWHISKTMIETYGMIAQSYFRNTFFNNKDLQPLASSLVEIFNNVFDHSNSTINGYVITQYFPNLHKLTFSICDFGVGIPTSVNNYRISKGEQSIQDVLAIEKALVRGYTSRSTPRNAGFGLANVGDFVKDSKGKMDIFSNCGYYSVGYGVQDSYRNLPISFIGTLVDVTIDTNTFELIDNDCETFDFL